MNNTKLLIIAISVAIAFVVFGFITSVAGQIEESVNTHTPSAIEMVTSDASGTSK